MARTFKAIVRYDGTGFAGWQIQPGRRTVQGEIEAALLRIAGEPIRITGSGRTDAGVHALGQVFSFNWEKPHAPEVLRRSLAKMLRPEILVTHVEEAPPDFNARYAATSKRYAYAITTANDEDPFASRYAWRLPRDFDLARLDTLCQHAIGTHDFAGFQCSGASVKTTVRTIYSITRLPGGFVQPCDNRDLWRIEFYGDGFLYKMVRNLVGTAVDIARNTLPESRMGELLASPGPFHGHTAPAHGLALIEVNY